MIHVKEKHKRFGIETQTQDILDELLAEYPSNKRTRKVLNNIHIIIERFKQLRRNFSTFDKAGNTESIKIKGANYKPLINKLKELNQKLYWILPVARNSHKLIDMDVEEDDQNDIEEIEFKFAVNTVMDAFQQFISNTVPDGQNKYNYLIQSLNPFFTPFLETSINNDVIIKQYVKENLDILINNYG